LFRTYLNAKWKDVKWYNRSRHKTVLSAPGVRVLVLGARRSFFDYLTNSTILPSSSITPIQISACRIVQHNILMIYVVLTLCFSLRYPIYQNIFFIEKIILLIYLVCLLCHVKANRFIKYPANVICYTKSTHKKKYSV
jgi:hypothetical protein